MEIKKVESVVMTGAELARVIKDYVSHCYKQYIEFDTIIVNGISGSVNTLDDDTHVIFKSEQV